MIGGLRRGFRTDGNGRSRAGGTYENKQGLKQRKRGRGGEGGE